MGVAAEIEALRRTIAVASEKDQGRFREENPVVSDIPPGVFNRRQRRRLDRAIPTIELSVNDLMAQLDIANFILERDFYHTVRNRGDKQVDYLLRFKDGDKEEGWLDNTPYQEIKFYYDTGGRFIPEEVGAHLVKLAVPEMVKEEDRFSIEEASGHIRSPYATEFCVAEVSSYEITQENVTNLLKILLANPREVDPTKE